MLFANTYALHQDASERTDLNAWVKKFAAQSNTKTFGLFDCCRTSQDFKDQPKRAAPSYGVFFILYAAKVDGTSIAVANDVSDYTRRVTEFFYQKKRLNLPIDIIQESFGKPQMVAPESTFTAKDNFLFILD